MGPPDSLPSLPRAHADVSSGRRALGSHVGALSLLAGWEGPLNLDCRAHGADTITDVLGFREMRRAADPQPPQLPADLERREIRALEHDATYAEVDLANLALTDQHANGVTFQTAKLTGVELAGSRLEHLGITDTQLTGCDLANLQSPRASATRAAISTSRLTGIALPEAVLRDVAIRGCRVDLASFGFTRLARVTFEDCLLVQTDFLEAQLESVRFHRCDLTRSDFRGAKLEHCEFRRSDLTDVQGVDSLRGAAMEWPDIIGMAGVWAAALGIEVLDQD